MDIIDLAHLLVEIRATLNLSQADFAKKIGVSQGTIAFWEGGGNPAGINSVRLRRFVEKNLPEYLRTLSKL